jgi:uncharacterized membrane protein
MNNNGQVVGWAQLNSDGSGVYFLYDENNGTFTQLPSIANYNIYGINEQGQLVGGGILATPE